MRGQTASDRTRAGPGGRACAPRGRGGTPRRRRTPRSTARFLGDDRDGGALVWGPEGWTEAELGLLGPVRRTPGARGRRRRRSGRRAGWPRRALARGPRPEPRHAAARAGPLPGGRPRPGGRRCGCRSPTRSFDLACSAYGAVPFVADAGAVFAEVARVLRPGGPLGVLGDPPGALGLPGRPWPGGARRRPARTSTGRRTSSGPRTAPPTYVEHHRTLGDLVRAARRLPACRCSTSWSPSGRSATTRRGAAGRRSAGGSCPARRSGCADASDGPSPAHRTIRVTRPDQRR